MKEAFAVSLLCSALLAGPAMAQQKAQDHSAHHPASATPAATNGADLTDGEVRKVDRDAGKITLKHGEIKNLDMPGMTMVFVVKERAMLDQVKAGDKVRFRAINDAGKFTVTDIQLAQ